MSTHDAIRDASIALAILNLVVSIAVASSAAYSSRQKIVQILIIWIAPVIGGVLFGLFMLTQRGNAPRTGYPSESSVDIGQIWSGLNPPDQKQ
jgi:cytochrome bd-type quinol oxidase subunit 2